MSEAQGTNYEHQVVVFLTHVNVVYNQPYTPNNT